jgi:hypothetical protein
MIANCCNDNNLPPSPTLRSDLECCKCMDNVPSSRVAPPRRLSSTNKVCFAPDGKDAVVENVITFTKHSSEHDRDLYWSRKEKGRFVAHAQRLAQKLRSIDPALKGRVEQAFYNSDFDELPREKRISDIQAISTWADSEGRGLEFSVFPCLREEQQNVVKQTVLYHQYLARAGRLHNGPSLDEALRVFSENRTVRSREFAVKMAVADVLTL